MVEHWEDCECRKCDRKRIEDLREENERLRERAEELTTLCNDRLCQRWDDNTEYRAEIDRLREAERDELKRALTEAERQRNVLIEQADQPADGRGPNGRPVCQNCGTEEGCHGGCDCDRNQPADAELTIDPGQEFTIKDTASEQPSYVCPTCHAATQECDRAQRAVSNANAENARLRSIIDTLTATAPATASLAVFLCSRCRESVDTVYESGSGANVEHVCVKCVQN